MDGLGIVGLVVLALFLVPIVAVDLKQRRIPDAYNLALAAAGLGYTAARTLDPVTLGWALVQAAAAGALLPAVLWAAGRWRSGARMGGGDIKFLVAAGLWVGLEGALAVLVLSSLMVLIQVVVRRTPGGGAWIEERPFAPMLAASLMTVAIVLELGR